MKNLFFSLLVLFNISQLAAQTMSSVPLAKLETLHSNIVGEDYTLHVTLPFGHDPNGKKYPVLYYLDAWSTSATINEMTLGFMWFKKIDPVIFVGISYDTDPFSVGKLRKRDYQPPINELDKKNGGDKFLQFIKTELAPYIEKNYAANPNDRGLMGGSLGGLFCTYAMKEEPDLFDKFIVTSPSLWYSDEYLLKDEELLKNINNASKKEVFISVGSLENPGMISYANQLYDLVKTNKNIQSHKVIFDQEDHGSVGLPASSRGIRYLYKNKFENLKDIAFSHYKKKEYAKGLENLKLAFEVAPEKVDEGDRYNIACFYALVNDTEKAFHYLNMIVERKYKDYKHIKKDEDLVSLYSDTVSYTHLTLPTNREV